MDSAAQLLFVYGTLKRGDSNHGQLDGEIFVGEARTVPGYRLFALDGFPGLVPLAGDGQGVFGEVWSVKPAALARLDRFEGVDEGLYRREPIPLLPPFANRTVHAYVYPHSVSGRADLGSVWIG